MSAATEKAGIAATGRGENLTVVGSPEKAAPQFKEPPPEKPSDARKRSWVIFSFWAIVLCLGLPIWWNTTTIYRANLPLSQMLEWSDGKACRPVIPLRISLDPGHIEQHEADNLLRLTQLALDDLNDFSGHHLRLQLAESGIDEKKLSANSALLIRLHSGDGAELASSSLDQQAPVLDITYPPAYAPTASSPSSSLATYIASELRSVFVEEQNIISYLLESSSIPSEHRPKELSPEVAESLSKRMTRSLKYSPTYHLTFSLFTNGASPSGWDIETALDAYMRPVLDMLSPIHNFTIDTQVQLYASPGVQSEVLSKEDLSSFINAAEWPLSPSIGGAPTINFVMYAGNHTIGLPPTSEAEAASVETSQSWLIPQWGSVFLLPPPAGDQVSSDQLKAPVMTFTSHLLSLLGTPQAGSLPLRLSTLTRVRAAGLLLSASSSLGSLARLAVALPSIEIPSRVADGVAKSMHHLQLACQNLGGADSLEHARIAEAEAERAFFEKSMIGQLYFPDEHKVAVYLPLLGPVGVPLILGALNEFKAWRKRRKQRQEEVAAKKA